MTLAIASNGNGTEVQVDGIEYAFASDTDPIMFASEIEDDPETENDAELIAWGWKAAAALLAAGHKTVCL